MDLNLLFFLRSDSKSHSLKLSSSFPFLTWSFKNQKLEVEFYSTTDNLYCYYGNHSRKPLIFPDFFWHIIHQHKISIRCCVAFIAFCKEKLNHYKYDYCYPSYDFKSFHLVNFSLYFTTFQHLATVIWISYFFFST